MNGAERLFANVSAPTTMISAAARMTPLRGGLDGRGAAPSGDVLRA
jgi:hypothetical protein